jgi:hypothetical protein
MQDEANMIAAFRPILTRICTGEVVSFTGLPDVDGLVEAWPTVVEACDRWKQTRAVAHSELSIGLFSSARADATRSSHL